MLVDIGQKNSIQLSAQFLGCILIARGAGMVQKQMQRYSEFVDSVNVVLIP